MPALAPYLRALTLGLATLGTFAACTAGPMRNRPVDRPTAAKAEPVDEPPRLVPGPSSSAPLAPIEAAFEKVQSSVVTIHTAATNQSLTRPGRVVTEGGIASGTLITFNRVLTAARAVQTADEILVRFFNGTVVSGRVLSTDPMSDMALIELLEDAPANARPITLADSAPVRVGQDVFVVGAPFGISHSLTVGVLSARRMAPSVLGGEATVEVFQTDAAVNPGNSGGPLFDDQGNLIGIVSYFLSHSGGSEGLGFAVTSNLCRERFLGRSPIWSGIDFVPLDGTIATTLGLREGETGLLVQRVGARSIAERLGVREGTIPIEVEGRKLLVGGDIILGVMGLPLDAQGRSDKVRALLEAMGADDTLRVDVLRDGQRETLTGRWGALLAQ
jgi:S1-C subfamily serine protease